MPPGSVIAHMAGTTVFDELFPARPDAEQHLDAVDRMIITTLSADGRASYAAIGQQVGLSRSQARLRLRRLLDEGIVAVHGTVNPQLVDQLLPTVALVRAPDTARDVARSLLDDDEAMFVVEVDGAYDLVVQFECPTLDRVATQLDRLRSAPGVGRVETLSVLSYPKQNWMPDEVRATRPVTTSAAPLDDVDLELTAALADDGRASVVSMATRVGLSESATRARVNRLIRTGAVAIEVVPGIGSVAIDRTFAVLFSVVGTLRHAVAGVTAMRNVATVLTVSGQFAAGVEAWAPDDAERDAIVERISGLPGVRDIEVLRYTIGHRYRSDVAGR